MQEVTMRATVSVTVDEGQVTEVRIIPDYGNAGTLDAELTGSDEAIEVVKSTTWPPLADLPAGVVWEG